MSVYSVLLVFVHLLGEDLDAGHKRTLWGVPGVGSPWNDGGWRR